MSDPEVEAREGGTPKSKVEGHDLDLPEPEAGRAGSEHSESFDIISTPEVSINVEEAIDENEEVEKAAEAIDAVIAAAACLSVDPDGDTEFFEKFSSIRIQYENSERKRIEEFQFQPDDTDGTIADKIFPTIGGWNVDDLYGEVLYAVVHTLTSDNQQNPLESDPLISHLQQAFHIDNDKHQKLLLSAKEKKAPPMVLNMEVVEAKGLHGKDVNGLSDPFCTIYISQKNKCNTSMKPETLTPVWREYFSFPVTSKEETLSIEVWDYDPEESVTDKMRRFGEVKSTKGLRVLMKEITLTATTGKQQHDFLGWIKIPLKNIPPSGYDDWFRLEGKNGNGGKKNRGEILLRMAIGTEKEKKVAAQEYRHALHLLLVHDLDEENILPYQWGGQFKNKYSEYILRQLQWQGGLTPVDMDMAKWLAYSRVQCDHALHPKIFPALFESISSYLESQASEDEIRKFWVLSEKLVENFINFIRTIHQSFLSNSDMSSQVYHILKTLGLLKNHLATSKTSTPELTSGLSVASIVEKITSAVTMGAADMFSNIIQIDDSAEETPVENMIKVGQLLIADLRKGLDIVNACFVELVDVDYFDITYRVYDEKYCVLVKPVVTAVCSNLRRLDIKGEDGIPEDQDMSMGTSLFELYLAVRQFSDLSESIKRKDDLHIASVFHNWFYASVAQWLDIAFYKAMSRIRRAVQIDNLKPVDQYVQRSSSAVDTSNIFHQIRIFWNQLAWPDVEGSYTFIAKILDDLCRCIISYGELMCRKVEELEQRKQQSIAKYEISDELCIAVNNIEYVSLEMKPISGKLGTEEILVELEARDIRGGSQCRRTLETVMENAIENINNKIYEILEQVGGKMEPVIYRLLLEGAEAINEEAGVEKLMKYLDKSLIKIKNKTTPAGFDKLFSIIWENTGIALRELVRNNIEKRRPPTFFKQIHTMLQIMLDFFYPDKSAAEAVLQENTSIQELLYLLELHGAPTPLLIMKYQHKRYEYQVALPQKASTYGLLTIRTDYCEDTQTLRIELLNARNLRSGDANGLCDPYAKIHIVPDELYTSTPKQKTKVKKKTLFPLFDETFAIPMTQNEMSLGGLIRFGLKDHDLFGRNDFLGEVYLPLVGVPFTTSDTPLKNLPQTHLVLTKPTDLNTVALQTLENRIWDKVATDYVKKERTKLEPVNSEGSIGNA